MVLTKCYTLLLIDLKYLKSIIVLFNYLNLYNIGLILLLLCMVIIENYVHRTYSPFVGKREIILHIASYFHNEYILCKESIVNMKA